MSCDLEHAIGCNVEYRSIFHLHPNGTDYVKAVGGVVIVGSLVDPHEQAFLRGHSDFITCLAVSHRGNLCASGQQGANADVILWNLDSKQQVCCFEEQDHGIDAVVFSHDDRFLCATGDIKDGRLFVYDTSSLLIIATAQLCPKPTACIIAGGFVKDIKRRETHEYMFAACGGKTLALWHLDVARGDLVAHQVGSSGKQTREYTCMVFSMDYEYLFAGSSTGDVAVVLMKNRVVQAFIPVCSAGVLQLLCLPASSGARLAAGGGDGTATVLSGPSCTELREEKQVRLDGPVSSMSLSGDTQEFMAVSGVGSHFQVRCKDLSVRMHNQVNPGALYDVAYLAGSTDRFLTCCGDGMVTLWDANDYTAALRCPSKTRSYPISCCGTEDIIVTGCNDGKLMGFDSKLGENLWHIDNAHKGGATSVKLSSNVRFIVSGGADGELRIWELRNREMASHLKEHVGKVTEVVLFPNDQFAISCSRDRCLLTWDLRTEKRLTHHREKHGGINTLALHSNQTTVVTAGQEKTMTIWDLRMADAVDTIELDEELMTVEFSPNDRYLATAGTGQTVKIWDFEQRMPISQGTGHSRMIQKVAFAPDGKQVVSAALDHSALVWNIYEK